MNDTDEKISYKKPKKVGELKTPYDFVVMRCHECKQYKANQFFNAKDYSDSKTKLVCKGCDSKND
jgi:hypothetical protein